MLDHITNTDRDRFITETLGKSPQREIVYHSLQTLDQLATLPFTEKGERQTGNVLTLSEPVQPNLIQKTLKIDDFSLGKQVAEVDLKHLYLFCECGIAFGLEKVLDFLPKTTDTIFREGMLEGLLEVLTREL